jgi:hypothetical protein
MIVIRVPNCPDEANCRLIRIDVGQDKAVCVGKLVRPHGMHKYSMCIFYQDSVTRLLLKDINIDLFKTMIETLDTVRKRDVQQE